MDKILSPKEWTRFGAGRSLKDSALLRALVRLEFFDDDIDQGPLALAEAEKQLAALRKTQPGASAVGLRLAGMAAALADLQKEKKAEEQARSLLFDALSKSSVDAHLASMRRGDDRQVLVASVGKRAVVLMSKREIPNNRRVVLQQYLGAGKPRYETGSGSFQDGSFTFRFDAPAKGLSRKIRLAVIEQAQVKVNVVVQDALTGETEVLSAEDDSGLGESIESDTPDTADVTAGSGPSIEPGLDTGPASPTSPASTASTASPGEPSGTSGVASPARVRSPKSAALTLRLSALKSDIQRVLATGHETSATVRTLVREVTEQVAREDFSQAQQAVTALEAVLRSSSASSPDLQATAATATATAATATTATATTTASADAERKAMLAEFEPLRLQCNSLLARSVGDPEWFLTQRQPARELVDRLLRGLVGAAATPAEMRPPLDALRHTLPALTELDAKRNAWGEFTRLGLPLAQKTLALPTGGHQGMQQAQAALAQVVARIELPESWLGATLAEVRALVGTLQAARDGVQQASAARLRVLREQAGPAEARAQMVAQADALPQLAEVGEGRDLLDLLVADIGRTAHGEVDNRFVKLALDARFQAQFSGDLDSDAGVRLYGIFQRVPDAHTRLNPEIREVRRNKNLVPESWYGSEANEEAGLGPGHIVLNGVRSGGLLAWTSDALGNAVSSHRYRNVQKGRKLNLFDKVTLHEIGHGVDEKLKYMDSRGHEPDFGGWLTHTVEEVADAVGRETGFFRVFADQPLPMLQACLKDALSPHFDADKFKRKSRAATGLTDPMLRQDPGIVLAVAATGERAWREGDEAFLATRLHEATEAIALTGQARELAKEAVGAILSATPPDQAIAQVLGLASGPDLDWHAVSQHTAVHLCLGIRQKGGAGLWDKGEAAKQYALSGRIYQQSYSESWCSYLASARSIRVSNYQFRAPGEWFAECYSAFYQDKLPAGHPLHAFLVAQDQS